MFSFDDAKKQSVIFFNGDELAANTYLKKYAMTSKDGKNILEPTPDYMWRRLAKAAASIEKDKQFWEKEFYRILTDFKAVPQGSILFALGNVNQKSSSSNCFVFSVEDSIESIFDTAKEMARTYSYRGGCGLDISTLRPSSALVSNAAKSSSGAASFMQLYSDITRMIGTHGRRGALMLTIGIDHPDVELFTRMKHDLTKVTGANVSIRITDDFMRAIENDKEWTATFKTKHETIEKKWKARDLWKIIIDSATKTAEPGMLFWDNVIKNSPADCYGESYKSTSTNPCCISMEQEVFVKTKDGFKEIKSLTKNDYVYQRIEDRFVRTSGYFKSGIAKVYRVTFDNGKYLDITENHKLLSNKLEFIELRNITKSDRFLNSRAQKIRIVSKEYIGEKEVGCINVPDEHYFEANGILSGNSELPLEPYGACTLLSMNLTKYTRNDFTDKSHFDEDSFFKDVSTATRFLDNVKTIDSDLMPLEQQRIHAKESRRIGMGIHGLADTLANLRIKYDSEDGVKFIGDLFKKYTKYVYKSSVELAKEKGPFPIFDARKEKNHPFLERIGFAGIPRRNIACMTVAPTGTVSLLSQTSSGIEPVFRNVYKRRVKLNHNEKLKEQDKVFTDLLGDKWLEYDVYHHNVERFTKLYGKELPKYFVTSDEIDWKKRVEIQATITKWLDHSCSSTVNLPKGTSPETVSKIYFEAWKSGCKGITVYVDGCRDGVLITEETKEESFDSILRPQKIPCDIYRILAESKEWVVIIGLLNGKPYEVFCGRDKGINEDLKKMTKGYIEKETRGKYSLHIGENTLIGDISTLFTDTQGVITRLISTSLRHNVDIKFVVQQLEKSDGAIHSFNKTIARVLKKYIKDGEIENGAKCESCGAESLVRQEGCVKCLSCAWTKCS